MSKTHSLKKTIKDGGLSGKLVLIEWVDSHFRPGWSRDTPCEAALTCLSAGFLTYDGKDAKTVSAHMTVEDDGDNQRSGDMTIPVCAIISMKVLL